MYDQRTVSLAISTFLCLVGVGALFIPVDASASPGLPRFVATDPSRNRFPRPPASSGLRFA